MKSKKSPVKKSSKKSNSPQKKEKITKNMNISDVIKKHPETTFIFMGYGLHCVGCAFAELDTIEAGAKTHGLDNETIDLMIRDLNKVVEEKFAK